MTGILVTGASGLLGRATVARLSLTQEVYALVREQPSHPLPGSVKLIVHDLRSVEEPKPPSIPDTIIHLAQSPRYREFPEGALDVFEINVASTQRLLDWASRNGVRRFVYASSGGIYGNGASEYAEDVPIPVNTGLGHYLTSKHCGELIAATYAGRMTIVVLRPFFVYGPGQRETMLIPRLIGCVLRGDPILLQGHDGIRINPIYVDDAAAAVEAATRLQATDVINVAGPEALTLRSLGESIGEIVDRRPRFDVRPDAETGNFVGSIEKMTRLLGAPTITVVDGVRRMVHDLSRLASKSEAAIRGPAG